MEANFGKNNNNANAGAGANANAKAKAAAEAAAEAKRFNEGDEGDVGGAEKNGAMAVQAAAAAERRSRKQSGGAKKSAKSRKASKSAKKTRKASKAEKTPAVGSKAQVFHGSAKHTSGGLTKSDLMKHKGRIVSRKKHALGKKAFKNLVKAGYKPKKGTFKLFKA